MRSLSSKLIVALFVAILGHASARAEGEFTYPQSGWLSFVYATPRPSGQHGALDICGVDRSAVVAARAGIVTWAGWDMSGYGNLVLVRHEDSYFTLYAHLSEIRVRSGRRVARGQTLGLEGSTGNSTGPHVHFEIRRFGRKLFIPGRTRAFVVRGQSIACTYPMRPAPQVRVIAPQAMEVLTSGLQIRTGPAPYCQAILTLPWRYFVVADRECDGWYRVWVDHRAGWFYGADLARRTGLTGVRIVASLTSVYAAADVASDVTGQCTAEAMFVVRAAVDGWVKIDHHGAQGWIRASETAAMGF